MGEASTGASGVHRVLILTSVVAPYRIASFSALADIPGIQLTVGFLRHGNPRHPWNRPAQPLPFPHTILGDRVPPIVRALRAIVLARPDVVIVGGWNEPTYLAVAALRLVSRFRLVVWSESTASDARPGSTWREALKRWVVRRADALLVPGRAAAQYARTLGAARLYTAVNAVDNDSFRPGGSSGGTLAMPRVLYVGRLAGEKGVDILLRAWRRVEDEAQAELVLIGSGPQEPALRQQASELHLRRIKWIPFMQQVELRGWYRDADVLVLPSRSEPWGFVVNEAMASGLPVLVSSAAGAAWDLVDEGTTGQIVPPGRADALATALITLLRDAERRAAMGIAARERIAAFTPEAWAHSVARMVSEL